MVKLLGKNIKQVLGCFLVIILIHSTSHAQGASANTLELVGPPSVEKTYLHTDRSYYNVGESLWYKAYSVYAYNNILYDNSGVLYVELISSDSKIIARNKTRLALGLGHGDFKLTDSIGVKPGTYQLRAYTNWSRNFGEDFVFKKTIEIMDVFDRGTNEKDGDEKVKAESAVIDNGNTRSTYDVQFFPEGGSLVDGISSIVAFKAVDHYGRPIQVEGKIFNSDGEIINLFKSVHDGMGKFQLMPIKGKQYHAKIVALNGVSLEVSLPKVNAQGYLLSVKKFKGKNIVVIKTNPETLLQHPNAPLTIIGKTRGITYFEGTQPLTKTSLSFELPKSDFPDGISQITLYDTNLRPQSERLLFIEKDNDFEIALTTDKMSYKTKETVSITVVSKSKTGEVVPASFSLSSTDMNGIEDTKDYSMTISSYFLMESDIKGKVCNPGYYFDRSNPKRLYALELLLLTQGWRDFLWKKLPVVKDSLIYRVEKGITIGGTVKQLFGKKPKVNSNVTLALFSAKKADILSCVTDSVGKFQFKDLVFTGKASMMLNNRNERGKNGGMFLLDSLYLPPMPVNFKKENLTAIKQNELIKQNVYRKHMIFGVAPENVLDEVEIVVKKKDKTPSLYGRADNTYVIDENTQHFSDIYQLIQFYIPGVTAIGGKVGFNRYGGQPAYILVDGAPWEQDDLAGMHTDNVAKIEAFKGPSAAIFGSKGGNGVILIYTKTGDASPNVKKKFHSIKKDIDGFYNARYFYIPNQEDAAFEMDKSGAIRNTLYWNPYVHPDGSGTVKVSYPNSEVETRVKVVLEGLTVNGVPVVKKTYYNIER